MIESIGELVPDGARIALLVDGSLRDVTALDVFRAAVRGVDRVGGVAIRPIRDTCPNVRFHEQPELVGVRVAGGDDLRADAVIEGRGALEAVQAGTDQALIGGHWYPLEVETSLAVHAWLKEHAPRGLLTPDGYLDLYRGQSRSFAIRDLVDDASLARLTASAPTDLGLLGTLYPYQEVGVGWLRARADHRVGGILGDEMGLGKTLQLIGLLADRIAKGFSPGLVVVPLTLMENWRREFAKFAPTIRVYSHRGPGRSRRPMLLQEQEVVLTTYDVAVIDEPVLSLVHWDAVILDEAQAIKNPDTQRARALKGLPRASGFASTGTPLENRTQDVWSLLDFAVPGYLGDRSDFADRLEEDPTGLRISLRPMMLRREVASVATDLPEKIEIDVALEMLGPEAAGYERLLGGVAVDRKVPALALITKLRQYTAHPDCLDGRRDRPADRSAKLMRLLEIAEEISLDGAKALVFCAFHEPADILREAIARAYAVPAWTIDGRTAVEDRQGIIDAFSSSAGSAFLVLNPAAAGVGLNIQAATHVIHYTLEWNPAREAQATARAWRRGQDRPVTVHRMYYAGTIDEAILERLDAKKELFEQVVVETRDEDMTLRALLERAVAFGPVSTEE